MTTVPEGFALIDGEASLPEPSMTNPQSHVKFMRLQCRESENLYLTDEVLGLIGITWEDAQRKIKKEAAKHGEKAVGLQQCDTWDRKQVDIKDVIRQLEEILDEKRVPWTLRVAKCLGTQRPSGQIEEFLGDEVIVGLWGPA